MPKKPTKTALPGQEKPKAKKAKAGAQAKKNATATSAAVVPSLNPAAPNAQVLDRLWATILSRKTADPNVSHSARLLSRGTGKVAQKFGEEAVECLIEAVAGNRDALIAESADVLYHLLVMWVSAGLRPEEVWLEIQRREGVSGIAEKAARPALLAVTKTRKIP